MAMDKDSVKGSATRTGGKMKQAAGDLTGDTKLQSEGKMDQAKGKVQNAVGGLNDALKLSRRSKPVRYETHCPTEHLVRRHDSCAA